jgi:predicted nucleic acid-binding protein
LRWPIEPNVDLILCDDKDFVTFLHKISLPAKPQPVAVISDALGPIRAIAPDADLVSSAVAVRAKYGLHFYDGMIVAAAERVGSKRIWSEDLGGGHAYLGSG